MRELRLIHNDDGTQPLSHVHLGQVRKDLETWVDGVLTGSVDAYVGCTAHPDVVYHESKVGERFGSRPGQKFAHAKQWHRARALDELASQGTDMLKVLINRVHQHDRLFFAGIRMSDAHHRSGPGFPDDPLYPKFAHDHPEFRIQNAEGKLDVCLDYTYQEVRDHRLAIIRELLFDYKVDGLELDFMRWCAHFPRPASSKQIRLMTMFIAEVRGMMVEAAEARGCTEPLVLGIRVPPTLEECKPNGLSPASWAREELIDYMTPANFLFADMNIMLDDYLQVMRATKCRVLYSIQPWTAAAGSPKTAPYQRAFTIEIPEFKALAANAYSAGAHGLHCFNLCCELPGRADEINEAFAVMIDKKEWRKGPRHYQFFPTDGGVSMTGADLRQSLTFRPDKLNDAQAFTFQIADGSRTVPLEGIINWRIFEACLSDQWRFRLNGEMIPDEHIFVENRPSGFPVRVGAELPAHVFFQVDLKHVSLRFRNQLEIIPISLEMGYEASRVMEVLEAWVFN